MNPSGDRQQSGGKRDPAACVGKKNWLFFGSEEAGTRNAAVFTLIQNCRLHGIGPCAYLKDMLEKLPTMTNRQLAALTPLQWKKAREAEALAKAV